MIQKEKIFLLVAIIVVFFYGINIVNACEGLIINEVQTVGAGNKTKQDFVELYNSTENPINLKGCRLVKRTEDGLTDTSIKSWTTDETVLAQGFYLWANSSDSYAQNIKADSATTQTIASDNGIALRMGKENEGKIIDSVGWGACSNIFVEGNVFTSNPEAGQSLVRKNFLDTNNNQNDFEISVDPLPQGSKTDNYSPECGNSILDKNEECDDGNKTNGDGCSEQCLKETNGNETNNNENNSTNQNNNSGSEQIYEINTKYKLGDVVINEIVSDPADGESEWIELFNTTNSDINLKNWTIEDGGGAKTNLSGTIAGSGVGKFFIILSPKGSLNNQGDKVALFNRDALVDQLIYGDWDDGNKGDNAPVTTDPYSLARKINGYNSYNNINDFVVTKTPTKGTSNIITNDEENEYLSNSTKYDYSDKIIITEFLPNPAGEDAKGEFIEIQNKDNRQVNLLGWQLSNGNKKKFEFKKDRIIQPGEYLAIERSESKIALNNSSGQVMLLAPLKEIPQVTVNYAHVEEGQSYNYFCTSQNFECYWTYSEKITPGKPNVVSAINHAPIADFSFPEVLIIGQPIVFDSSDAIDEDDDKLTYQWKFGDGATSTLSNPEHTYFKAGSYKISLTVKDQKEESKKEKTILVKDQFSIKALDEESKTPNLLINEFLPDPEGTDDEEWIELYNAGETTVNVLNWRIDDQEGGSKPYNFSSNILINSKGYYVLERSESGLALNNNGDSVRLFNDSNDLIDNVIYSKAITGEAYARENNKWQWTTTPTPGEENIIQIINKNVKIVKKKVANAKKTSSGIYVETSLEQIGNFDIGENVEVKGTVAVLPGSFGTQYFYIIGSPGIQVYSYYKKFPQLKVGDIIAVRGELSKINQEKRIKIKEASDISVIEHKDPPLAKIIPCEAVGEEYLNQLVTVSGEVTDKKSSLVYLDDGTNEAVLYIKKLTGISTASVKVGDQLSVTGLVGFNKNDLVVLPRSMDDIKFEQNAKGQVLGEAATNTEWQISARDKKLELFKYLLIIAGGIILVLGGVLVRLRVK
jgi:cysteine-rich repeat protein